MGKLFTAGTSGKIFAVSLSDFFAEGETEHPGKTGVIASHVIGDNIPGRRDDFLNQIPHDVK